MRVQIQVRIVSDDDTVLSEDVIACFDKGDDQLEEIGLSLEQAKTVLAGAQVSLVAAQATSFLTRHRDCEQCGRHLQSKGRCRFMFRTAFGTIPLISPRVHRCACQAAASKTFFQPVDGAVYRPHRPGAALLGDALGIADVLWFDSRPAEGRAAGLYQDQCRDHPQPPAQGRASTGGRTRQWTILPR